MVVKERGGARIKLKGCARCGGDLVKEEGKWKCFQCGRIKAEETDKAFKYKTGRQLKW